MHYEDGGVHICADYFAENERRVTKMYYEKNAFRACEHVKEDQLPYAGRPITVRCDTSVRFSGQIWDCGKRLLFR